MYPVVPVSRPSAALSAALFVVFASAYLIRSPSLVNQHWDSLEYAWSCEARGARVTWGNHPLGHLVLCGTFNVAATLGYEGRALPLLKGVNALAGALAVAAFFALLTMLSVPRVRALAWSLVFGATYGMWRFSGTADIYVLAVVLLLLASLGVLTIAVGHGGRSSAGLQSGGSSFLTGALVSLALLAHQFSGPLVLAGLAGLVPAFLARGRRALAAELGALLLAASAVTLVGYVALGALARGSLDAAAIWHWMVGYGADPMYGRYLNVTGAATAFGSWTETLVRTSWAPGLFLVRLGILAMLGVFAAMGIALAVRLPSAMLVATRASACQVAAGWVLVAWWEPFHIGKFWLLVLPAFVVLVACGFEAVDAILARDRLLPRLRPLGWLPFFLAFLVWFLNSEAASREHAANPAFERTLALWTEHSRSDDVLIESDELTAHLLFWARRPNTVNLYRALEAGHHTGDPFAVLKTTIDDALRGGRSVILAPGLGRYYTDDRLRLVGASREEVLAFFQRYAWIGPLFQYENRAGTETLPAFALGMK
jgi:hypothetical protein